MSIASGTTSSTSFFAEFKVIEFLFIIRIPTTFDLPEDSTDDTVLSSDTSSQSTNKATPEIPSSESFDGGLTLSTLNSGFILLYFSSREPEVRFKGGDVSSSSLYSLLVLPESL